MMLRILRSTVTNRPFILLVRSKSYKRTSLASYTDSEYKEYLKQKESPIPKPRLEKEKTPRESLTLALDKLKFRKVNNETRNMFRKMMYNVKSSSYRENHKVCLLMGRNLINEALRAGTFIRTIYFSELHLLEKLPYDIVRNTNLVHIPIAAMREISDERTDGLFALASQQDSKSRQKIRSQRTDDSNRGKINLLPVTLICDGIKDAKIMGDVLKVALSSGCQQVYVMEGCVNIWNTSVLKRAAAAHFKIPILPNQEWENMEKLVSHEFPQSVFLSHGGENGSTIYDFTNDPEVTRIGKNSGVIETIKRESSMEFNSDEDILVKGHIPPINLDEVVWPKKPSILIVGDITFGAFSFAVKLQNRGSDCRVIKLPLSVNGDMLTPTIEASVLLFDALRQNLKNKAEKT